MGGTAMATRFETQTPLNLYVVRTNPDPNSKHHGSRRNTSEFVVTFSPGAGDQIVYALDGALDTTLELREVSTWDKSGTEPKWVRVAARAGLSLVSGVVPRPAKTAAGETYWVESVALRFGSHPGRGPALGEDGLEAALGNPVLEDLLAERAGALLGAECGREWAYAPAEVSEVAGADEGGAPRRLCLDFEFEDTPTGWTRYKSHTAKWED